MKFELFSEDFPDGGVIPDRYSSTRAGQNLSPPLRWENPPNGTQSFTLMMEDLDIPFGFRFTHWIFYNIPAGMSELAEGIQRNRNPLINGAIQGRNGFRRNSYLGPNPVWGNHRYQFTIYALDIRLTPNPGMNMKRLLSAVDGHVLDKATLIGRYSKK